MWSSAAEKESPGLSTGSSNFDAGLSEAMLLCSLVSSSSGPALSLVGVIGRRSRSSFQKEARLLTMLLPCTTLGRCVPCSAPAPHCVHRLHVLLSSPSLKRLHTLLCGPSSMTLSQWVLCCLSLIQ